MFPIDSIRGSLYSSFNTLAFFILLIFNLIHFKRRKEIPSLLSKSNVGIIIEIFLASCAQYLPASFFNGFWGKLMSTGANYFGLLFFAPFFLLFYCWLFRVNPLKQFDLVAPAYPLALVSVKFACFVMGCCRGFKCSWGLYNYNHDCTEFPTQLLEAAVALFLFFLLLYLRNKVSPGTLFPIYTLLYSTIRFFTEFTRREPDVHGFFNTYQLICLIGMVIGFVEYFLVIEYSNKIEHFFTKKFFKRA